MVYVKSLQLCTTLCDPWTLALQSSLFTGFSRQEYWSGLHALPQGTFQIQGSNPHLLWLLHCQQIIYCWATREALNILWYTYVMDKFKRMNRPTATYQKTHPGFIKFFKKSENYTYITIHFTVKWKTTWIYIHIYMFFVVVFVAKSCVTLLRPRGL